MSTDYPFGMLPVVEASIDSNARIFSEIPNYNTQILEMFQREGIEAVLRDTRTFLNSHPEGKILLQLLNLAKNLNEEGFKAPNVSTEPTPRPFIAIEGLTVDGERVPIAEITNDQQDTIGSTVVSDEIFNEIKALCQLSNGELVK